MSRRSFLRYGTAGGAMLVVPWRLVGPAAASTGLLDPTTQPKFVNSLPNALAPPFIFRGKGNGYEIGAFQFGQRLGLVEPTTGVPLTTTVWGYGDRRGATYPGRTIEAVRGEPLDVRWTNELFAGGRPLPHLLPVDTSIHWAYEDAPYSLSANGVPIVSHLHGGHTESDSDGLPEYWFTPKFETVGPRWAKETYRYANDQEAATLWYHDHALGITRLNVYAGLAGFYILRDELDTGKPNNPLGLPAGKYELAAAIQDRTFDTSGQLFLPSEPEEEGQPSPSIIAEFFGDHILVNGVTWPKLDVERRKYRLRLLNGSDSRFYVLQLSPEGSDERLPFHQIGTDAGLLHKPVGLDRLILGPGERADLILDFADPALAGRRVVMRNTGPDDPFRGLNADGTNSDGEGGVLPPADPATTGLVMAFDVVQRRSGQPDRFDVDAQLRSAEFSVGGATAQTRELVLFEAEDEYGRLRPQLGTLADGSLLWHDPSAGELVGSGNQRDHYTELPALDTTEEWVVYNATEDAHPIHLHLVSFQLLGRAPFEGEVADVTPAGYHGTKLQLTDVSVDDSASSGPAPNETGPKDTAQMYPGQVTRLKAHFDRPGRYVWHCHILSHEDHEMMRPYYVRS